MYRVPALLAVAFLGAGAANADAPRLLKLRTQKVDDTTFFHVRFHAPPGFSFTFIDWLERYRTLHPKLTRLPRLVCQDGGAAETYPWLARNDHTVHLESLEFYGK